MLPITRELLGLFFQNPTTEFAYREIERKTGISIATVSKYIASLVKEGLVKTRRSANAILAKANLENQLFTKLKRSYNLEVVYSSGLVQYLIDALRPDAIILFGSFSKGEDDEKSDIDIAVIHGRETEPDTRQFEKALSRKISIIKIKSFKLPEKEFINSLVNGVVLEGSVEVV